MINAIISCLEDENYLVQVVSLNQAARNGLYVQSFEPLEAAVRQQAQDTAGGGGSDLAEQKGQPSFTTHIHLVVREAEHGQQIRNKQ